MVNILRYDVDKHSGGVCGNATSDFQNQHTAPDGMSVLKGRMAGDPRLVGWPSVISMIGKILVAMEGNYRQ